MEKTIFDYQDYKAYLNETILARPKKGRGVKSALAVAIGSPLSHVSQVLKGISNLTFEQAEEVNYFLGHSKEEGDFFILLVQLSRAGTPRLRKRVENQISQALEKRLILKERLEVKKSVSRQDQEMYYSSWHYAAVHMLLTIGRYQTSKEWIGRRLGISINKVNDILEYLLSIGLVKHSNNRYQTAEARIHLGNDSPTIARHHTNWRMMAIRSLDKESSHEDLHYSSVISIAKADALKIKSGLVKQIETTKKLIQTSAEEELYCFDLDFFVV